MWNSGCGIAVGRTQIGCGKCKLNVYRPQFFCKNFKWWLKFANRYSCLFKVHGKFCVLSPPVVYGLGKRCVRSIWLIDNISREQTANNLNFSPKVNLEVFLCLNVQLSSRGQKLKMKEIGEFTLFGWINWRFWQKVHIRLFSLIIFYWSATDSQSKREVLEICNINEKNVIAWFLFLIPPPICQIFKIFRQMVTWHITWLINTIFIL